MRRFLFTLLVSLVVSMGIDAQRTTTSTSTSTLTSTVTVTNKFVCAKLVNVTGVCRRRRGFLIDEPVVLTFDDELDESIDDTFQQVLLPGQFIHTRTQSVEVTPLVVLPDDVNIEDPSGGFYRHPNLNLSTSMDIVESSVEDRMNNFQKRKGHQAQARMNDDDPQSRIYFSQLAAIASAVLEALRPSTVTLTTTITVTQSSDRSTTTTFKTTSFFIMGCTPSPLPFATCPAGKRWLTLADNNF